MLVLLVVMYFKIIVNVFLKHRYTDSTILDADGEDAVELMITVSYTPVCVCVCHHLEC